MYQQFHLLNSLKAELQNEQHLLQQMRDVQKQLPKGYDTIWPVNMITSIEEYDIRENGGRFLSQSSFLKTNSLSPSCRQTVIFPRQSPY